MGGGDLDDVLERAGHYTRGSVGAAWFIADDNVFARVRDAITEHGTLYAWAAAHPEAEPLSGRDTLYAVPGPGPGRWLIRRLTHGGLLAPLTGDRFLRLGVPRPLNEARVAQRLHEAGVPTPDVLAAAVYPGGPFYRGEVARREIRDAADLAACLFDAESAGDERRRSAAMEAAGKLVGCIHRAGLIHPDLNMRNVLVRWTDPRPTGYILDLEKCRFGKVGPRRRRRMLGRLRRSARRFEQRTGRGVRVEEWEAFWRAYSTAERIL